jgi:hypothetical protein
MKQNFRIIVGGIIAYILIVLYGGIALYIIQKVIACSNDPSCKTLVLHDGLVYVLTTVGGLVSALVVSKMTITNPGKDPALIANFGEKQPMIVNIIIWFYLLLWTVIGLAALIIGVIIYPGICKTLSDFGTTWLGLAVATGYAYFGIEAKS